MMESSIVIIFVLLVSIHMLTGELAQTEGFKIYIANITRDIANEVYDNFVNGYADGHFIIEMQQQRGQFIYIKRNGSDNLNICEVKVFTDNLALHKSVSMAPQYSTWKKEFATDANIRTDAAVCECCAATNLMTDPWLQVDLGAVYKISTIIIYGRSDSFGEDQHLIGMDVFVKHLATDTGTLIYTVLSQTTVVNINLPRYTSSRYIHLILKGNSTLLVVCDIQVSPEVCPPYQYGDTCENDCHCKERTCNDTSGICPPGGCEPGYQLPTCSIPCNDTFYGDCTEPCGNCRTSPICNKTTGYCNDCQDGYQLSSLWSLCKTECTDGKYGYHCGESCGNCLDMSDCNNVAGTCHVCLPGYQGPKCDTPCADGYYGNCMQQCGECRTTCNKTTGYCDDCKDGYIFPLCQSGCQIGTYGHYCTKSCAKCAELMECSNIDGTCPACLSGFHGSKCDTPCPDGRFGFNCSMTCGQCVGNDVCDKINGTCPSGCLDTYKPPVCNLHECSVYTYGLNCSKKCGQCKDDSTCDEVTGVCPSGCIEDYTGSLCTTRIDSNSNDIVLAAVGGASAVVVIVIFGAIGVFCYLKRKKTRKEETERRNDYTDLNVFATPLEESPYASIKPDEVEHRYENVNTASKRNRSNSKFVCGCICEGH